MLRPALFALVAAVVLAACGTDASGVEACRQIEEARCRQGPNCGIDMSKPVHRDSPKTDIDACIRWYDDACMHGMMVADPGGPQTQACVAAINTGDCPTVLHPESNAACAWLLPPNTPASDAAADGPTDAGTSSPGKWFDAAGIFDAAHP